MALVSADLSALSQHIHMSDRSMTQRAIWVHMSIEAERWSYEPRTIFSQVSKPPANHSPSRKLTSLLIGGRDFETSSNSSVLCWYCWRQLLPQIEKAFHFQNKEKCVDISLQDIMFSKKCLLDCRFVKEVIFDLLVVWNNSSGLSDQNLKGSIPLS